MLNDEKFAFLRIEDKQLLGKSKSETKAPVCVQKVLNVVSHFT